MVNHGDKKNMNQEGADKAPSSVSKGGGGGATRHAVPMFLVNLYQPAAVLGPPLSRSEAAATTTSNRMNNLDIQGEDAVSRAAAGNKKKRNQHAVGGDKSSPGLRQFSMKVWGKLESRGRTTYNGRMQNEILLQGG